LRLDSSVLKTSRIGHWSENVLSELNTFNFSFSYTRG